MTDFNIVGVTNVLQHISFPVAILISLLSWGLGIPVDYRGLATYKNHFFHSLNTLSCAAAMLVLDQDWRSGSLVLPFRYGLAYALSQFVLQRLGDKNHKYLLLLLLHVWSGMCRPAGAVPLPGLLGCPRAGGGRGPGLRRAAAPHPHGALPRRGHHPGQEGPGQGSRLDTCHVEHSVLCCNHYLYFVSVINLLL